MNVMYYVHSYFILSMLYPGSLFIRLQQFSQSQIKLSYNFKFPSTVKVIACTKQSMLHSFRNMDTGQYERERWGHWAKWGPAGDETAAPGLTLGAGVVTSVIRCPRPPEADIGCDRSQEILSVPGQLLLTRTQVTVNWCALNKTRVSFTFYMFQHNHLAIKQKIFFQA